MWLLTNDVTGKNFALHLEKCLFTVGRISADLILGHDSSISRSHAVLSITEDNPDRLELRDENSKYGTYCNENIERNIRLGKHTSFRLDHRDRIRFGVLQNIWTVHHMPLIVKTSALTEAKVMNLQRHLNSVGAKILQSEDGEYTHLTMESLAVTMKFLNALLDQRPIVTCEFWRDFAKAVHNNASALPLPESYMPQWGDKLMSKRNVKLESSAARKHLFKGKTFVFLSKKQFEIYAPMVKKASGEVRDLNSGVQKTFLKRDNVIVIQYMSYTQSQDSQTINGIENYLESCSRRVIPEFEIGLAIVYVSTKKYCNPTYTALTDFISASEVMNTNSDEITETVAINTECLSTNLSEMFIPETGSTSTQLQTPFNIETDCASSTTSDDKQTVSDGKNYNVDIASMLVSESIHEESRKRKRSTNPLFQSDDSDDEPLRLSNVKTQRLDNAPRMENTDQMTVAKSGTIVASTTKLEIPANTSIFSSTALEKLRPSQAKEATKTTKNSQSNEKSTSQGQQDNQHKSEKSAKPMKPRLENNSDNEIKFNLGNVPNTPAEEHEEDAEDYVCTEKIVSEKLGKFKIGPRPQPKALPKKIVITGWLSCAPDKANLSVKKEDNDTENLVQPLKDQSSVDGERVEEKEESSLPGFVIRPGNIILREQSHSENSDFANNDSQTIITSGKIFVKQNYARSYQMISTICPMHMR